MSSQNFAFLDEENDDYEPLLVIAVQPKDWDTYLAEMKPGTTENIEVAPGSSPDHVDVCIEECTAIMEVYHADGQWYFTDEELATFKTNMETFVRVLHAYPEYRALWDELQAAAEDELPRIIKYEYDWIDEHVDASEREEADVQWPTYRQMFVKRTVMKGIRSTFGDVMTKR